MTTRACETGSQTSRSEITEPFIPDSRPDPPVTDYLCRSGVRFAARDGTGLRYSPGPETRVRGSFEQARKGGEEALAAPGDGTETG